VEEAWCGGGMVWRRHGVEEDSVRFWRGLCRDSNPTTVLADVNQATVTRCS
jgi:hypothetical protein